MARKIRESMPAACGHFTYADGHCAVMSCWNYLSKCPVHAIASYDRDSKPCTLETENEVVKSTK